MSDGRDWDEVAAAQLVVVYAKAEMACYGTPLATADLESFRNAVFQSEIGGASMRAADGTTQLQNPGVEQEWNARTKIREACRAAFSRGHPEHNVICSVLA